MLPKAVSPDLFSKSRAPGPNGDAGTVRPKGALVALQSEGSPPHRTRPFGRVGTLPHIVPMSFGRVTCYWTLRKPCPCHRGSALEAVVYFGM